MDRMGHNTLRLAIFAVVVMVLGVTYMIQSTERYALEVTKERERPGISQLDVRMEEAKHGK